jgi:hypothetical protein
LETPRGKRGTNSDLTNDPVTMTGSLVFANAFINQSSSPSCCRCAELIKI